MPLYMVETISYFRHRFVIDAKNASHAEDEVVCNMGDADHKLWHEFSQKHIDENIISTREIDEKEYLKMFDVDNDYLKSWPKKDKMRFINKIDYTK